MKIVHSIEFFEIRIKLRHKSFQKKQAHRGFYVSNWRTVFSASRKCLVCLLWHHNSRWRLEKCSYNVRILQLLNIARYGLQILQYNIFMKNKYDVLFNIISELKFQDGGLKLAVKVWNVKRHHVDVFQTSNFTLQSSLVIGIRCNMHFYQNKSCLLMVIENFQGVVTVKHFKIPSWNLATQFTYGLKA